MCPSLVRCLVLVTLLTFIVLECTSTSLPEGRDNVTNDDEDQGLLKQEMTQLRTELLEALGQLREEMNVKTATASIVPRTFYGPPHHFHHYYHHRRPPVYRPEDMGATDELSTLRELLQATENRLRTTEQKLLSLEDRLEVEVDDQQATRSRPRSCEDKLFVTQEELALAKKKLALVDESISNTEALRITVTNQGSTFVRWGRTLCPNNTQLVYSGTTGGARYEHKGAAANRLCLTLEPEFDETALPGGYGYLYGAEYQDIVGHHDHDVPCSVCRAPQSTTVMVPATLTCPPGWLTQYAGHLMAGHHSHVGAGEFLCVDGEPEHMAGGHENKDGALFYLMVTACGSLPCPPYVGNKVVTCVVCSL